MHGRNFFSVDKSVANPLKTLLALDHLDDQLSLNRFMILNDVWLELLVSTTDLSDDIISLLLKMDLVDTNQEKAALDMNDWDGDIQLID